jgi:rhodanese-related sulfurtransferase
MAMTYHQLVQEALASVPEWQPWDLAAALAQPLPLLVLDIREPLEFAAAHIAGSLNVPRGLLEQGAEWGYDETEPDLVRARDRPVVIVCRSGNRSALAARTLQLMGFADVRSLKTGLRGWNDYEQPLVNATGEAVDADAADALFTARVRPDQMPPK